MCSLVTEQNKNNVVGNQNYWGIPYDYRRLYAVRDVSTDILVEIGNMLRDGYDIRWITRQTSNVV